MKPENIGSFLDDCLRARMSKSQPRAIKRVLARQIASEMTAQQLSKAAMAKRMHTSRAALDRLLDPQSDSVNPEHPAQGSNGDRPVDTPGTGMTLTRASLRAATGLNCP